MKSKYLLTYSDINLLDGELPRQRLIKESDYSKIARQIEKLDTYVYGNEVINTPVNSVGLRDAYGMVVCFRGKTDNTIAFIDILGNLVYADDIEGVELDYLINKYDSLYDNEKLLCEIEELKRKATDVEAVKIIGKINVSKLINEIHKIYEKKLKFYENMIKIQENTINNLEEYYKRVDFGQIFKMAQIMKEHNGIVYADGSICVEHITMDKISYCDNIIKVDELKARKNEIEDLMGKIIDMGETVFENTYENIGMIDDELYIHKLQIDIHNGKFEEAECEEARHFNVSSSNSVCIGEFRNVECNVDTLNGLLNSLKIGNLDNSYGDNLSKFYTEVCMIYLLIKNGLANKVLETGEVYYSDLKKLITKSGGKNVWSV